MVSFRRTLSPENTVRVKKYRQKIWFWRVKRLIRGRFSLRKDLFQKAYFADTQPHHIIIIDVNLALFVAFRATLIGGLELDHPANETVYSSFRPRRFLDFSRWSRWPDYHWDVC